MSSIQVSREFGGVPPQQCKTYETDRANVIGNRMSLQDFLNKAQAGEYYQDLNNGFCKRVELTPADAAGITSADQVTGKLKTVRIQKKSSGGFSADTKVRITPSIPFRIRLTAAGQTVDISITTMSLYHPAPLRLEGEQADAILSLNDPSFDNPAFVVLVPLVARNIPSSSVGFLQKILSNSVAVSQPDPSTGEYVKKDVATGVDWTLDKLFTVQKNCTTKGFDVLDGFYQWKGMPVLEQVRTETEDTRQFGNRTLSLGTKTVRLSWVPSGEPSPSYILLDKPVACNPVDLGTLTQRMPVTLPDDAIHAVLYSSNPLNRGIVHKEAQTPQNAPVSRESFTDLRGVNESSCDPWTVWASAPTDNRFTSANITSLIMNALVVLAMAVGAFLALSAVLRMYDVEYADFSKGLGKVTAVFVRSLKEKASALKQKVSGLKSIAKPGAAGALGKGGPAGALGALSESTDSVESPLDRRAAAKAEQTADLTSPFPRVSKTRRAAIPLDRRLVGPTSVSLPSKPQFPTVKTPYLTGTGPGKQFTRRGGTSHTRS